MQSGRREIDEHWMARWTGRGGGEDQSASRVSTRLILAVGCGLRTVNVRMAALGATIGIHQARDCRQYGQYDGGSSGSGHSIRRPSPDLVILLHITPINVKLQGTRPISPRVCKPPGHGQPRKLFGRFDTLVEMLPLVRNSRARGREVSGSHDGGWRYHGLI